MEIRCEKCATEYELDESRISSAGLKVRCTTCGHVFKVARPQQVPPAAAGLELRHLRDQSVVACPDLATLQRWIVERRVGPEDEFRENGGAWQRLGTREDLTAFFALISAPASVQPGAGQVSEATPPMWAGPPRPAAEPGAVDETAALNSGATLRFAAPKLTYGVQGGGFAAPPAEAPASPEVRPGPAPADSPTIPYHQAMRVPEAVQTIIQPGGPAHQQAPTPAPAQPASPPAAARVVAPAPGPKPTPAPASPPRMEAKDDFDVDEDPELAQFQRRGRTGRLVAVFLVLLIVAGAAAYHFYGEELQARFLPAAPTVTPVAGAEDFAEGRRLYLAFEVKRFDEARAALSRALEKRSGEEAAKTHAALAELETAWAEHLLLLADRNGDPGLRKRAQEQLERAYDHVRRAASASPDHPATDRALLDYYRASKSPVQAEAAARRLSRSEDPETRAHIAMARALDEKQRTSARESLEALLDAAPQFKRARFWLAQLRAEAGDPDGANVLWKQFGLEQAVPEPPEEEEATPPSAPPASPAVAERPASPRPARTESAPPERRRFNVDRTMMQANRMLSQGKAGEALDLYDQVIEARPRQVEAHYGRGLALFDLERAREAVKAHQRALELNPNFADAMIGLAEAYKDLRSNAEAVRWYRRYLEVLPGGDQAAVARANVDALAP